MNTIEERLLRYRDALEHAAADGPERDRIADAPQGEGTGKRRRVGSGRQRASLAAVLIVALAMGGLVVAFRVRHDTHPPVMSPVPIGRWHQGARPPFSMHSPMQATTLDDGRVLVLGELPHGSTPDAPFEGGVYDPAADTWQTVPAAPFVGGASFQTAGDFVVAMTVDVTPPHAAMLDLTTMNWKSIMLPEDFGVGLGTTPTAWDGQTWVIVRTGVTADGGSTPATMRWNRTTEAWTNGAEPPLAARSFPIVAADTVKGQLAVWGGFSSDPTLQSAVPIGAQIDGSISNITPRTLDPAGGALTGVFTNGAIYDITSDTWTVIDNDDTMLEMAQFGAEAVLADGDLTLVSSSSAVVGDTNPPRLAATLTPAGWQTLPSPKVEGMMMRAHFDTVVISTGQGGPHATQFLDTAGGTWIDAPASAIVGGQDGIVAITTAADNPADDITRTWLSRGTSWEPAADAPFATRSDPAITATGSLVVVIGGDAGPDWAHQSDVWILDLSAN